MAGKQRRKAMIHELEKRLAQWAETQDEDKTYDVVDYACSWVASGNTMTKLSDEIGESMQWDISRDMIMRYLNSIQPDTYRRLEKARLDGAHGLVDGAIKIVDDANTSDKEHLQKAKMRADVRLWIAEKWNKKDLGKAPDVQVNLNFNTLHLDAMRVRQLQLAEQRNTLPASEAAHARLIGVETTHSEDVVIDAVIEPGPLDS